MGTSPLQSLQKSTPNSYILCPHLNLQRRLQIHLRFRGLCAKLHHKHFEKGSDQQIIITMQFLGRNYPKSIYGMGNFKEMIKLTKIRESTRGLLQNWPSSN